MRFAVVSTCHLAGWTQYARRMVETFDRFWPADIPLYLYAENFQPDHPRPIVRALPAWLAEFKARHIDNPYAHGMIDGSYVARMDCVRFSHKVAAFTDAALTLDVDILICVDADVITHAPVDAHWLGSLFPPGPYIAWLARYQKFPEGGFYMLRCKHPAHRSVMTRWRGLYETDAVLKLVQTHDAQSLLQVIEEAEGQGLLTTHSLSGDAQRHGHPLINGPLGARLDHLKGQRKERGRSQLSDLIRPRSEPYWQASKKPRANKTAEPTKSAAAPVKARASRYSQLPILIALMKPETIIEVGTNQGASAESMCLEALKHRPKVHYVGFDVFETKDADFHKRAFNGKGAPSKQRVHARLQSIVSRFPSFSFELIEGETSSTLHHRSMRADFVFIDGDHRIDIIRRDYAALAKSRVVVFDDFFDPDSAQGKELIGKVGCNQVVAALDDVTILPLIDSFPATGPIRMAVRTRKSLLRRWFLR